MAWALVVVATAVALAGCGGAAEEERPAQAAEEPSASVPQQPGIRPLTRPEYARAVREIVEGPAAQATSLFHALVAGELTPTECAETARAFARALDRIVDGAASLSPPAHVAELHGRFVAAAGKAVADVKPALAGAEAGETACGEPVNAEIYGLPATEAAERILARIEAKGYVILGQ